LLASRVQDTRDTLEAQRRHTCTGRRHTTPRQPREMALNWCTMSAAEVGFSMCARRFEPIPNHIRDSRYSHWTLRYMVEREGASVPRGRDSERYEPSRTDDCCGGTWGRRDPSGLMRTMKQAWNRSSRRALSDTRFPRHHCPRPRRSRSLHRSSTSCATVLSRRELLQRPHSLSWRG
jgi:hypothetical protein